jgi:hypothetical protein
MRMKAGRDYLSRQALVATQAAGRRALASLDGRELNAELRRFAALVREKFLLDVPVPPGDEPSDLVSLECGTVGQLIERSQLK